MLMVKAQERLWTLAQADVLVQESGLTPGIH
jgi:hypothetical protein